MVLALLVTPLAVRLGKVHDETGEWRLWPAQAPALLSYDGLDFRRLDGPVPRPVDVAGVAYTPGGGLVLQPYPLPPELTQIWVLDHDNVVHRYVTAGRPGGA